jgi:hypothetical protein
MCPFLGISGCLDVSISRDFTFFTEKCSEGCVFFHHLQRELDNKTRSVSLYNALKHIIYKVVCVCTCAWQQTPVQFF